MPTGRPPPRRAHHADVLIDEWIIASHSCRSYAQISHGLNELIQEASLMQGITQMTRMERMSDYLRGEAVRSLDLLRAIDGTIESLVLLRRQMNAFSETVESHIKSVLAETKVVFEEDAIIPTLEQSQDILRSIHDGLQGQLKSAKNSTQLHSDDGVDDAYAQAIEAVIGYNATIERLRWSILEHNADMEGEHRPHLLGSKADIDGFFDSL